MHLKQLQSPYCTVNPKTMNIKQIVVKSKEYIQGVTHPDGIIYIIPIIFSKMYNKRYLCHVKVLINLYSKTFR